MAIKESVFLIGNQSGYTSLYKIDLRSPGKKPELIVEGEKSEEFEAFHFSERDWIFHQKEYWRLQPKAVKTMRCICMT